MVHTGIVYELAPALDRITLLGPAYAIDDRTEFINENFESPDPRFDGRPLSAAEFAAMIESGAATRVISLWSTPGHRVRKVQFGIAPDPQARTAFFLRFEDGGQGRSVLRVDGGSWALAAGLVDAQGAPLIDRSGAVLQQGKWPRPGDRVRMFMAGDAVVRLARDTGVGGIDPAVADAFAALVGRRAVEQWARLDEGAGAFGAGEMNIAELGRAAVVDFAVRSEVPLGSRPRAHTCCAAPGRLALRARAEGGEVVVDLVGDGPEIGSMAVAIEYEGLRFVRAPDQASADGLLVVADASSQRLEIIASRAPVSLRFRRSGAGGVLRVVDAAVRTTGLASAAAADFALGANYPNPFNPTTTIPYRLAAPGQVELVIYNTLGQRIRALVAQRQTAGTYRMEWDGRDAAGRGVAGGVYFYQLTVRQDGAAPFSQVRKLTLAK